MKKMKKLLSMLLAVVMVLAMAAPSFATEAGKGKITVDNATANHQYTLYKLFDANPSGPVDGESKTDPIAYTATSDQKDFFENLGEKNPFVFTSNTDGTYNVEVKENFSLDGKNGDEAVINAIKNIDYKNNSDVFVKIAGPLAPNSTEKVVFDDVPFGYYFVESSLGGLVTITSTNKNATILDKNQKPSWPKDAKKILTVNGVDPTTVAETNYDASADYGDIVKYEVKVNTTNYDGAKPIAHYWIRDILVPGMSYSPSNSLTADDIEVYVGEVKEENKISSQHYIVTSDPNYQYTYKDKDGNDKTETRESFVVKIDWFTFKNNTADFIHDSKSADVLTIRYNAKVEDTAIIAKNGNENIAQYKYNTWDPEDGSEDPEPEEWEEEKKTRVYTFAFAINKVNSDGEALAGAEFKVFERITVDGEVTEIPVNLKADNTIKGVYLYSKPVDGESINNTVISPSVSNGEQGTTGLITVKGLGKGTYIVKETKAPEGYNVLEEALDPIEPSIEHVLEYTETIHYYKAVDGTITEEATGTAGEQTFEVVATVGVKAATVVNYAGTLLPSTGGIGTTIFYAAGIILMAGAVFFVVRRKRA